MSDEKRERRGHFRGKPRPGRRVEVLYRIIEGGKLAEQKRAFTKNIGIGGAFIFTPEPAQVGSQLQIQLHVPSAGRPIEVRAEVRWLLDGAQQKDPLLHGMGVRFAGLDVEQLLTLNEYFASLTATVDHDEA